MAPRASSAPALELNTLIFKHVYWYMQQISGESLQDHWSSGFILCLPILVLDFKPLHERTIRSDSSRPVQSQKQVSCLIIWI